jgi:hypothetical protein
MANKLGATFLRCSLGPLHYAGGLIMASKVEGGLGELSADNLHGGLTRGIDEIARQAGVGVVDVQELLPMGDVAACAARLDAAQRGAVHAWKTHAGHLGGLMAGVADLTVDGRAPDVSNFLARLAKKVVRDPELSEPLDALSVEVANWLDLVERCSDLIGDGDMLARAYQRRRLRRQGALATAVAAVVGLLGVVLWLWAVRARVDAALAVADPCAAEGISPADLERASGGQQKLAAERRATCAEARKREVEARAEQALREAEAREAEQRKREHEAQCDTLARHLAAGSMGPEDAAAAGPAEALLGRAARGALEGADLVVADLPCRDTAAAPQLDAAFAAGVAASSGAWARPEEVSERVYAALVARKDALPGSPKQVLAAHADKVAMKAIVSRDDAAKARATRICHLKDDLGMRGGKYCATLFVLAGKK